MADIHSIQGVCPPRVEPFDRTAASRQTSDRRVAPTVVGAESCRPMALFVVVSGPPASGKSTLAPVLARGLKLPLLAKDTIKDALMSKLAVPDVDASRQLGRAAV